MRFMRRYLSLDVLGLLIYISYPMAAPWLAAQNDIISDHISRITGRGCTPSQGRRFHQKLSAVGNPVAAMPSVHAGIALFVALWGITQLHRRWRRLLLLYPLTMSFMLVYYAEHYVVDVLAGYAAAGLVLWAWATWERSPQASRARRAPASEIAGQVQPSS